jgi:superfamily I DNA/RNA helicase/RecB family exonuclease
MRAMSTNPFPMDAEQRLVVSHADGPLLVTGGPGTGKTAALRARVVRLLEDGADPERVALVVRTRRDRHAARDALLRALDRSLPGLRVTTMQGLAFDAVGRGHAELGYAGPPSILAAADHLARVRQLLDGEDAGDWPVYGGMLPLRGFADEVRQFLVRAQEALLSPEDVRERAEAAGARGFVELAGFYRRYLDVLAAAGEVDFAGLVVQAGRAAEATDPAFDHVIVDDYQDATFAAEGLLLALRPGSLAVAGDAGSHVFSFQGTTAEPLAGFVKTFGGAEHVSLGTPHRFVARPADGAPVEDLPGEDSGPSGAASGPTVEGWIGAHASEEHAAVARELRRVHVRDGIAWSDLAVIVRRKGPDLVGVVRAMDAARIPSVVPETDLALQAQPATFPYLLALRWAARPHERDALIEPVLVSDLGALSPAAARGLLRAAAAGGEPPAAALDSEEGLAEDEVASLRMLRSTLERAAAAAGRSVLDTFSILWRELACSARLVAAAETPEGRAGLDAVRSLADAVERCSVRTDPSVAAFLDLIESGEEGLGLGRADDEGDEGVRVLTAHAAAGREFDTVVVCGLVEGNFPSLSRPEPMFDLAAFGPARRQSERNRERLEDERRLFHVAVTRARRRALLTASAAKTGGAGADARSRFAAEAGVDWTPLSVGPFGDPLSVAEAEAAWRRDLARPGEPAAERLAALSGLGALGVDPARWWFQREWTDTDRPLHDGAGVRVSYSRLEKLENCALQYVLGEELGLEDRAGYHAWVGNLVHKLLEECEEGKIDRTEEALVAAANERWRPQEFPSRAVSEAFRRAVANRMLPAWVREYGESPSLARELRFEFSLEGATVSGYIDRVGAVQTGGTIITDYKTGKKTNTAPPEENLQLGIYYLALNEVPELAPFLPVKAVELAFLKERSRGAISRAQLPLTPSTAGDYRAAMRERLLGLVHRVRELESTENYRPSPAANCFHCRFKPLCPMFPEGRDVIAPEAAT